MGDFIWIPMEPLANTNFQTKNTEHFRKKLISKLQQNGKTIVL